MKDKDDEKVLQQRILELKVNEAKEQYDKAEN